MRNRNKQPQPLFKVERVPDSKALKENEVYPIYNLQFLLHRRITVEEPHKRNGPDQCANGREYGTLRSVCVACGGLHTSAMCELNNEPNNKKCSNCGGDHTANYRGCPVYKELKNPINQRVSTARSHHTPLIPSKSTPEVFFSSAVRSSFSSSAINKNVSFARVIKSGNASPAYNFQSPPTVSYQPAEHTKNKMETMILTLQHSMDEFISSMRTTMHSMLTNQNILIKKQ